MKYEAVFLKISSSGVVSGIAIAGFYVILAHNRYFFVSVFESLSYLFSEKLNEVTKCTMAETPCSCRELLINYWLIKPYLLD